MPKRTYVRGNRLSPETQAQIPQSHLKQYFQVDPQGLPISKPFRRRAEIELFEAKGDGDYEIIANSRGKPRIHESEQAKKAAHDRKRAKDPKRLQYQRDYQRDYQRKRRAQKGS